jgi:RNA polymerase sigma-70 factor, ECF subfamily
MADPAAALFAQIYAEHIGIVWKTVHAFALSKEDRDDLFQEIVIALWDALPNFEARAKLSTYVYRIAHRRALNWKRSQRRYGNKLARYEQDFPALTIAQSDPADQARLDWLYAAINSLKPLDRTICLLYLDGISYREMSEIVGLTEDNIGIRVHRCKQQLTQLIDRRHEEF